MCQEILFLNFGDGMQQ